MKLNLPTAEVFVPDGTAIPNALSRTTHLGIGAHPDDLEFMCLEGIATCYCNSEEWFTGVTITDGSGSARTGKYQNISDVEMIEIRREEQRKAAVIGEYAAVLQLGYQSRQVQDRDAANLIGDLREIILASSPQTVYIHNPADKHPTHVACAVHSIRAIRSIPMLNRPLRLIGCEVWRDLDWLNDADKVVMDLDNCEALGAQLAGVFDSQISGGKRYDLANIGRRRAHATYYDSHSVDQHQLMNFGMDLTPLIQDDSLDIVPYVLGFVDRFRQSTQLVLERFVL